LLQIEEETVVAALVTTKFTYSRERLRIEY